MNLNRLDLIPAYGRVYATAEAMLADWNAGKDFQISFGPYCSIRDMDLIITQYRNCDIMLLDPETYVHVYLHLR